MPKAISPTHQFSAMLEKGVHPVIAYARTGFFDMLEGLVNKQGRPLDSGRKLLEFGDFARVYRTEDNRHLPKGVRQVHLSLSFDSREGFRTASEAMRVRDVRPIAFGSVGPYTEAVMASAFFNNGYLDSLRQLEIELATARAKPASRLRAAAAPVKKP